ncbi:MAG TPA: DUF1045 domain-containing protein [Polaromonas sp.]|uniref:DUF1045 domain-containing protein n=1 Tax=Polaromonas sp. TaxID=1869339 RepID=UPI002D2285C3|nr:DUF1045 domain-containing protein [Polaromonas sp.]HYW55319.1 DUF1045 domain-containing protein [Polaromonas sp.]
MNNLLVTPRYAVYFSPDKLSPWWALGSHWLGRDEHNDAPLQQPALEGISAAELYNITQEPRHYGFHATLKAPFRLAAGQDEAGLISRLGTLASRLRPVPLGPLRAATLGNFVALVPEASPDRLLDLAAACVTELDDLRAEPVPSDRLRRRVETLDAREIELLDRYGYPYVMERYRFHMTLTGPVEQSVAARVTDAVASQVAQLNATNPMTLDRLCLFVEHAPQAPFQRILDLSLHA